LGRRYLLLLALHRQPGIVKGERITGMFIAVLAGRRRYRAQLADISWRAVSQNRRELCDAGLLSQRNVGDRQRVVTIGP
jgi:hypothetical protein